MRLCRSDDAVVKFAVDQNLASNLQPEKISCVPFRTIDVE
ncbi:hypothetical protein X741_34735 [Mesorhizobium sp. LNHC229A00]|nr:hypothetical protein X741_34735 [Mesorhizobium sp. LNHC229A00]